MKKKQKVHLLLDIVTICLCVCAIVIGIYAVKNAKMNISGTIGFESHDIEYTAKVYMYGHAGSDGAPVAEANKVQLTNVNNDKINFTIGSKNFSDTTNPGNPETIYIVITVTNSSSFNVALKTNLLECSAPDRIEIDAEKDTSACILASASSSSGTTGTIKYSLKVKPDSNGKYTDVTSGAVTLKVDLNRSKLSAGKKVRADIPLKKFTDSTNGGYYYPTAFPYYVEMGGVTGEEKVKWLIVGYVDSSDYNRCKRIDAANCTEFQEGMLPIDDNNFVLLSETVLFVDADADGGDGIGVSFQNAFNIDESTTPKCKNTDFPTYSAQDYATSVIRQYLLGNTVKWTFSDSGNEILPNGSEVNFLEGYNLTDDKIYKKIVTRYLDELYGADYAREEPAGTVWVRGEDQYPLNTNEDKFWLLSSVELNELLVEGYGWNMSDTVGYLEDVSGSSARPWWLRTPSSERACNGLLVGENGEISENKVCEPVAGVRPAFLL